jgi:phage-related protein/DNA-binding XRE family transcriptional regulator
MKRKRELYFYKDYFERFYESQTDRVKKKILWTLRVVSELEQIPDTYLKHIKNASGLYEIRVQVGNNIFRIFCFFDQDNLVVIGHGFQKKTQKTPKLQIEKAEQIKKNTMKTKSNKLTSLEDFIDREMGKVGSETREEFENEYDTFKLGVLIQQAREKKGLTQEQLAQLAGTNKSYISKLERNLKDIRFSTLQRIINEGLGGHLNISINLD